MGLGNSRADASGGERLAHQDWFQRIVDAVRDEYGCALVATPETQWVNVSEDLRGDLENCFRARVV
jgi:hypothetical protein